MKCWLYTISALLVICNHANAQADLLVRALSNVGDAKAQPMAVGDANARPIAIGDANARPVIGVQKKRSMWNHTEHMRYQMIPHDFGGFSNP